MKFPAQQPRDTQYGPRINVVITLDGGKEVKLWGNPGDTIANLRKGQPVSLMQDGKNWKMIASPDQPTSNGSTPAASPPAAAAVDPTDSDIRELVAIFQQLRLALPDAREDTCRAFASTIFMQRYRAEADF